MSRALLDQAESVDHYLEACANSPSNSLARQGNRYEPSFLKPIPSRRLHEIAQTIPLLAAANIIILQPSADNGYPHTRPGNIVCMPTGICEGGSESSLRTTLIHESIHLHQRLYGDKWKTFCQKEGWQPQPDTEIPPEFQETCRINPDTMSDPFWSWQTHYIPLPLFVPKWKSTLGDIVVKWYDMRNGSLYPDPPPSFFSMYGIDTPQPEHPYEIYAVQFANENIKSHEGILEKMQL
jgi:hypothetical protein